jgi:hypothetical protein
MPNQIPKNSRLFGQPRPTRRRCSQRQSGPVGAVARGSLTSGRLRQNPTTVSDCRVIQGELHLLPLPYIVIA